MIARTAACLAGLVVSCWAPVASPADRPPYCITLETLMAFAGRVKAHVAHCPSSNYAAALADWDKTRIDYAKLFSRYRCRRAR
jgi:hypothetical protein